MATGNTVVQTARHFVREDRRKAAAALTPGQLLEIDSNGDWALHSTAGGPSQKAVAMENDLAGEGIDTDIASGDLAPVAILQSGALFVGRLDNASANVVAGDPIESNGNGNVRKHVPQNLDLGGTGTVDIRVDQIIGYADEDVNSPASGSSKLQIRAA